MKTGINKRTIYKSSIPFTLLDSYGDKATYRCECQSVFMVDLNSRENMVWEPKESVVRAVCPDCSRKRPLE